MKLVSPESHLTESALQPEIVIRWSDSVSDACGWLVIDRLINGVCGGGTFMHATASEKEVTELAQTMSYKNALQSIPFGGAKAGIRYDHTLPDASAVLTRFLHHLKPWLETVWCTGADLNTSNPVMQQIINRLGLPSLFGSLGKMVAHRTNIEDQSREIFSRMIQKMTPYFTLAEGTTGYSVALTIGIVCRKKNPRVFIQGFGSVGRSLAYFLQEMNIGKVVGISDAGGTLYREGGIDTLELVQAFHASAAAEKNDMDQWLDRSLKKKYRYKKRENNNGEDYLIASLRDKRIDVFSPCAMRYAITTKVIDSIADQYDELCIVAGANNVFDSLSTRKASMKKNIHSFPEWISNCGNALLFEELLSLPELPPDYIAHLKAMIEKRIHAFINDSLPAASNPEQWHETFVQTAENRLSIRKKITGVSAEDARATFENVDTKNLTLIA